jgi:hypothetical protein
MKKNLINIAVFSLLFLITNVNAFGQNGPDTVSLVVSGQGATLEEARNNALRSAIEQAYGAFISTKTELLNDSLVKDEVVSVANGNIRNYTIVTEAEIHPSLYASTLRALVSISALETFCTNKGITSEFKGSLFARNIQLQRLNEINEMKALDHLSSAIKQMSLNIWTYSLKVNDPVLSQSSLNNWSIVCEVIVSPNKNLKTLNEFIYNSLLEIRMSSEEQAKYDKMAKPYFKLIVVKPNSNHANSDTRVAITWNNGPDEDNKISDNEKIGEVLHFRSRKSMAILNDIVDYLNYSIGNFVLSDDIDSINMVETQKNRRFHKYFYECVYNWHFNDGDDWEGAEYYKTKQIWISWNYSLTKLAINNHYKNKLDNLSYLREKVKVDEQYKYQLNEEEKELDFYYDSTRCYCAPFNESGGYSKVFEQVRLKGINSPLFINLNVKENSIASVKFYKNVTEDHISKIQGIRVIPMNIIDNLK